MKLTVLRVSAVLFSLLLMGNYVWYRGTGSVPLLRLFSSSSNQQQPAPQSVGQQTAAQSGDEIVVPHHIVQQMQRETVLPGSKSGGFDVTPPTNRSQDLFVSKEADQTQGRAVFPGSKFVVMDFELEHYKQPKKPKEIDASAYGTIPYGDEERVILPGSKTGLIDLNQTFEFQEKLEPMKKPVPQPKEQIQQERVIMGGSKSAKIAIPVTEQPKQQQTQRVQILPGSKSSAADFHEAFQREAKQQERKEPRTPKPEPGVQVQPRTPTTVLPGPKAFFPGILEQERIERGAQKQEGSR